MASRAEVLVTGATGFIGEAVCRALQVGGRSVRVATRSGRSPVPGLPVARVGDLTHAVPWEPIVREVAVVVHCAARAHVTQGAGRDALATFRRVNRDATLALARSAAAAGVRRFVFLSSIGVLGERTAPGHPFVATSTPAPLAAYAISKREAEEGLLAIGAEAGMEIVLIRPPLVIGAGAPGNFMRLLKLLDRGSPLPLGGIENRRSFVVRENLVDLIVASLEHPEAPRRPLLVAERRIVSTSELARMIRGALGRPERLFAVPGLAVLGRLPLLGGAVRKLTDSLEVDPRETEERLGWSPRILLERGVDEMCRAFRSKGAA